MTGVQTCALPIFGCSAGEEAVKGAGGRYGISTGRTGRFKTGHIPANKGKKHPSTGRTAETQFKKGRRPHTWKPAGTESIRRHRKRGQEYVYTKVAEPNVWRMKHILEWERHNGPVPPGKIIIFADGNTLNTDISNLVMVSRQQHAVMNHCGIRGYDRESMEAAAGIAELKGTMHRRKQELKGRKKRGGTCYGTWSAAA